MGILLIVIGIVFIVGAVVLDDMGIIYDGEPLCWIGIIVLIIGLGVSVFAAGTLINGRDVDDRIAMYEEQNAKIEEQVATAVQVYMQHENLVFDSTTPDSYITLVSLYPELKSDELMKKQIDVYISNNEKICKLKEEKVTLQRAKFWLYFGR